MAALLMEDIPQYSDFANRSGNYRNEPFEDPLEKLVYLAENKYWKWNNPDRLDTVISKILSRTKEIGSRLNHFNGKNGGKNSESIEIETFLLPEVVAYMDFIKTKMKAGHYEKSRSDKEGESIYQKIRDALDEEFCSPFYFADCPPHQHLHSDQDKISSAYWDDVRRIGPARMRGTPEANFSYNNPFDPRISFDGFQPWKKNSAEERRSTEENLFLATSDISGMLEQHTQQYRLFLRALQSRQHSNPLHHWSGVKDQGQGHGLDLSWLENVPLRYDENDKKMEKIVEPLLRDEVKFLWLFDQREQTSHLEQERQNGPGPIGPPKRRMWPPRTETPLDPTMTTNTNPRPNQFQRMSDTPTGSQLTDTPTACTDLESDEARTKWTDTYNWIPNMDAPAWKSASDPDLYCSSSQTAQMRATPSASTRDGTRSSNESSASTDIHVIPSRVTSDKRLPSKHKARPPPVRMEVSKQEYASTETDDANKSNERHNMREDRQRFWKETVNFVNGPSPNSNQRQRHDSKDTESTGSGQSDNAASVKVHGHYTPADHFKYMVHQLAAEVKQDDEETLPYQGRGSYRGRGSAGRTFVRGSPGTRGRGSYTYRRAGLETQYSNRRPFHWKRGVRNKFKWYSANYRDWNNDGDQTAESRVQNGADDDVEMVDVEQERWQVVDERKEEESRTVVLAEETLVPGDNKHSERIICGNESDKRLKRAAMDIEGKETGQATHVEDERESENVPKKITYSNIVNGTSPVAGGINDIGAKCATAAKLKTTDVSNTSPAKRYQINDAKVLNSSNDGTLGEIFILKNGKYVPKTSLTVPQNSSLDNKHTPFLRTSTPRHQEVRPVLHNVHTPDAGHPDNHTFRRSNAYTGRPNKWQLPNQAQGENEERHRPPITKNERPGAFGAARPATPRIPCDVSVPPPNMNRPLAQGPPLRPPPPQVRHPNPWSRGPPPPGFQNVYRFHAPPSQRHVQGNSQCEHGNRFHPPPRLPNGPPKPFQPHR